MTWLGLTIFAPLLAAGLIILFRSQSRRLAVAGTAGSVLSAVMLLRDGSAQLLAPGLPGLDIRLTADYQQATVGLIVALVASVVMVYATGYFAIQQPVRRFFVTFLGFVTAMQLFVFSGDFILLLAAWELMAVTSFLLIGHDIASRDGGRAATRAFLTTRAGDIGLYLAVFIIITGTGGSVLSSLGDLPSQSALAAGMLLAVAAAAKAAQLPFGGWLRDAMTGPTPVSALLHSATMVAAGVLLLVKVSPWLHEDALLFIAVIGGLTAVIAGAVAVVQTDLKRLLAASTSSQLGLMFLAVGAGVPAAALLHFAANAFIKSSLFLGAGIFQHARGDTSFTRLNGVGKTHSKTFAAMVLAGLALAGLPPLAGFWSKDTILAAAEQSSPWLFSLALLGSLLTAIYVASALRQLWHGHGTDTSRVRGTPLMGIAFGLLLAGVIVFGIFLTPLKNALGEVPGSISSMLLGIAMSLAGLTLGWYCRSYGSLERAVVVVSQALVLERGTRGASRYLVQLVSFGERGLDRTVGAIGAGSLGVAMVVRRVEEPSIEALFRFGSSLKLLSRRAMLKLQTGQVHQELAVSLGVSLAIGVIIAVFTTLLNGGYL